MNLIFYLIFLVKIDLWKDKSIKGVCSPSRSRWLRALRPLGDVGGDGSVGAIGDSIADFVKKKKLIFFDGLI